MRNARFFCVDKLLAATRPTPGDTLGNRRRARARVQASKLSEIVRDVCAPRYNHSRKAGVAWL